MHRALPSLLLIQSYSLIASNIGLYLLLESSKPQGLTGGISRLQIVPLWNERMFQYETVRTTIFDMEFTNQLINRMLGVGMVDE